MCGIVGYVGRRDASGVIMDGLIRLEYRGYDSAGIAVAAQGAGFDVRRAEGKLANLQKVLGKDPLSGNFGIGHTRWATHGKPTEDNAHPHRAGHVVLVHNGIIENHAELKAELVDGGREFASDTDTEIAAHLIDREVEGGASLTEAVRTALGRIIGSYALAVMSDVEPGVIVVAREASPIVLGVGEDEQFVASDIPALLSYTRDVIFLDDGEMATVTRGGIKIETLAGEPVERAPRRIDWNPSAAEKSGYKHFMLKEIHEQPRALVDTIRGRVIHGERKVDLSEAGFDEQLLGSLTRITIVACGTSWHAALVGKFMIEELARLPVEVDLASEYRGRNPIIEQGNLLLAISQSGETLDTLAAIKEAKERGAKIGAICNVIDSSIARASDAVLYTHAGPEIGVASTKAFTTQLMALYLLALKLAQVRQTLDEQRLSELVEELRKLPRLAEETIKRCDGLETLAHKYMHARDFLFLGRGYFYPIALEGALKLKEISYIHAEGYPAGEMKHGPIALIDEQLPVVTLCPEGAGRARMLSNVQEVKARDGRVIALANDGDDETVQLTDDAIMLPPCSPALGAILFSIPLQLLAYHIADLLGTDVDQPRNLAKSVTVE